MSSRLIDAPGEDERTSAEACPGLVYRRPRAILRRGDEDVDGVAEELDDHELGVRARVDDETELDPTAEHRVVDGRGRVVPERDLDLRRDLEELAHERRQEISAERLVAADDEAPDLVGLEPLDSILGAIDEGEDLGGVVQELLPGAGELNAAATPEKERRAEALFEVLDGDGQGRLADLEGLGGGGHAPALGDALEVTKVREVHENAP
jgi:hypothetical protein